jgi:RNA polymerase sigma-70 factor (ECF subfamily)
VPYKHEMESVAGAEAITDEDLIRRVRHYDTMAFEALVYRYQKPALRVAHRCVGQQAEAEDMVQEAFLRIYRHVRQYDPEAASFKTWFFSILVNLCRNAVRRNRAFSFTELPRDAPAAGDPEDNLARGEERASLAAAVARLPPNQRMALILRHYEGFSYSEAAAALGLSARAFGSLLARAQRSLRRELAGREKNFRSGDAFPRSACIKQRANSSE